MTAMGWDFMEKDANVYQTARTCSPCAFTSGGESDD